MTASRSAVFSPSSAAHSACGTLPKRVAASKPPEQRVNPQSELQLPGPPSGVAIHRNEERLELDQLRGDAQMNGALAQALAHQRELAGFQVAQSAVNELAGAARGAAGERLRAR